MKAYPSICRLNTEWIGRDCIAFDKLDGSNLRFMWTKKNGWTRYGTRTRLMDRTDPDYGCAIDMFHANLADPVATAVRSCFPRAEEFMVFAEFFGPHSFAGQHDPKWLGVESNDPKKLVPFDLNIHKYGLVPPAEFIQIMEGIEIPRIVYKGEFNENFVADVVQGVHNVYEGVIVKGCEGKPPHGLWMCKIKTQKYLEDLKKRFKNEWQQYV